jgi:hypothetical protein
MTDLITRRQFTAAAAATLGCAMTANADDPPKPAVGPTEAPFERDYPAPGFKPKWAKPQLNRQLVQDFVIYAHSDLDMTKKLLAKEPKLASAYMDWGAGDWESGLGGAAHMGRRDIAEFLLGNGARIDIFAAAMLGQLDAVKAMITAIPALIDAKGPHGFTLHFHAQVGGTKAEKVFEYLQSVKRLPVQAVPFKLPADAPKKPE